MPPLTDEAIESLRRTELVSTHECIYLDHATFGPPPASHVRAATEVLERTARQGSPGLGGTELLESVRAEAATVLRCAPRNVCLLTSTSEGLGLLAEGLDWRPGDEVVVHRRDFEGCLAPFLNLHARGVTVCAAAEANAIESVITDRTRAICLSIVDRVTGARAPIEEIAELCASRGIWLALDAAQALGVLALDAPVLGADVVAAHGYKFLLSGFGLAPTYCSDRAIAELRVPRAGWKNAVIGRDGAGLSVGFGNAAARFEPTMCSLPALAGMRESLRLLNGIDAGERERRALSAARAIATGLESLGFALCGPVTSAIVSARHPRLDTGELVATLRAARVVGAEVEGRLRLSPHFFATSTDVEALLAAIPV